jgi:hypothetical protein
MQQQTSKSSVTTADNTELDSVSKFFLLKAIVDYLANDLEMCLNVCSTNMSCVSNGSIFEGNILRFKALALEKMYEKEVREAEEEEEAEQDINKSSLDPVIYLVEAIEAILNSISIFSDTHKKSPRGRSSGPNQYGMALAEIQYALILKTHANVLGELEDQKLVKRLGKLKLHAVIDFQD